MKLAIYVNNRCFNDKPDNFVYRSFKYSGIKLHFMGRSI